VNRKYGQGLADEPEVVTVVLVSGDGGSIYRLVVAPNDVDRIVGKNNHTVRSMRVILSAIGAKLNRKVSLEIGE
jgi:predicted RNA-binding protein YlqC (UPF0109 family)